jgi:hypothetical protein
MNPVKNTEFLMNMLHKHFENKSEATKRFFEMYKETLIKYLVNKDYVAHTQQLLSYSNELLRYDPNVYKTFIREIQQIFMDMSKETIKADTTINNTSLQQTCENLTKEQVDEMVKVIKK